MMFIRSGATTIPILALSLSGAFAQTATQEGADRLQGVFQSYLGTTPGVVSVTPDGDAYKVQIDVTPLVALIPAEGLTVDFSPYVYTLTDRGDGTWSVVEDQAFSLRAAAPGIFDLNYSIGSIKSEGVWDESLKTFTTYKATMTDVAITSKSFLPDGTLASDDLQSFATGTFDVTGAPAANGGADITATIAYDGYQQTMTLPPVAPGAPLQQIVISADTYGGTSKSTGTRVGPMLDLAAWFVSKGSVEAITAGQAEMKPLLTAALPLWDNLAGDLTMTNLSVQSPVGTFGAATVSTVIDVNGLVADGKYRMSMTLDGMTTPPGLVPDWGTDLVPTGMVIDMTASRFNLADPARMFIDAFDLTNPDLVDPGAGMGMLGALLPEGNMDVTVSPSRITGPIYEVKAEGSMKAGPGQMPTGTATVTATGLDQVQAALGAAPPEVSSQFLLPLGMATGLARTEADGSLVWDIELAPTGSVIVNGTDLMGGAPSP